MLPNEKSATDLCGPDADTSDLHLQPVACLHQGVCKHSTTSIKVWCLQTQCYFNTVRVSANTVQLHYSQCLQTQCNFTTVSVCKHSATLLQSVSASTVQLHYSQCLQTQCNFTTVRVSANTVHLQYSECVCKHSATSIQ